MLGLKRPTDLLIDISQAEPTAEVPEDVILQQISSNQVGENADIAVEVSYIVIGIAVDVPSRKTPAVSDWNYVTR